MLIMKNRFDEATIRQISGPTRRSDVVYEAIRKAIVYRRIRRGEWLREGALANELGVSRTMVRDALTRLVAEGLALEVPYKGVQAASVTVAEVEEVFTIRARLESWAFELAAKSITEGDLSRMRALVQAASLDPGLEDFEETRQANKDFHMIAIHATGKRHLIRLLEQIWDLMPTDLLYPELPAEERRRVAEKELKAHQELVEALENGDGKRASSLLLDHVLSGTLDYIMSVIEDSETAMLEPVDEI